MHNFKGHIMDYQFELKSFAQGSCVDFFMKHNRYPKAQNIVWIQLIDLLHVVLPHLYHSMMDNTSYILEHNKYM